MGLTVSKVFSSSGQPKLVNSNHSQASSIFLTPPTVGNNSAPNPGSAPVKTQQEKVSWRE